MWLSNNKTKHSILIMLVDVFLINFSIILAYLIRFKFTLPTYNFQPYMEMFLWISLGSAIFLNMYHLYSASARKRWDDQFYSIVLAVSLTLMLSISLTYISANYSFPRSVFILSGILQVVFLTLWRYTLWRLDKRALGVQKAIIIGHLFDSIETVDRIKDFSESHLEITGILTDDTEQIDNARYRILGTAHDYERVLTMEDYDIIVVMPNVDRTIKEKIVCDCYSQGKEVFLIPDLYEVLLIKADLNVIDDIPVFNVKNSNGENDFFKRVIDVVLASLVMVGTLPVMALLALIIKIDSPGPIIYKQDRVTKGGRVFTLYKFRTMVHDAENETGPVLACENDQRATRVGRLLRLSRLDELPQFFNVLRGDMSVVGPRPERPFFVERFSREIYGYENRHRMKPGITGIAQIAGKYDTDPREKLVFDLLYAKRNNLLVDLQIMLHTVKILFMKNKAS